MGEGRRWCPLEGRADQGAREGCPLLDLFHGRRAGDSPMAQRCFGVTHFEDLELVAHGWGGLELVLDELELGE